MEGVWAVRERLPIVELLKGLAIACVLGSFLAPLSGKTSTSAKASPPSIRVRLLQTVGFLCLFLAASAWLALVDKYVPEPYLDEVFHIPQAQTYCESRFFDWDDKITTPPGLYLLSVVYHKLWLLPQCTPSSLRFINLLATLLTAFAASQCRHLIEIRMAERDGKPGPQGISWYAYHTGLNVSLFPIIFFFSGLYYTDVVSTLVVLVAYRNHLLRIGTQRPSLANDLCTVMLGIAALFMRQTNVFWVVVYMGGLEAVHVLRSVQSDSQPSQQKLKLHDPPLNQSGAEDWLACLLTIAITALCNPAKVLRQVWPHIAILGLFACFVAWNGGVVLGDKSNHIATIHLAQMLYIWPLFAFFSAPLLLPSIISAAFHPVRYLQSLLFISYGRSSSRWSSLLNLSSTLLAILLSLEVVKYNTIIHPFTLADNRHYMFYVFRYTILRSPSLRLSLVAAYTFCRWLAWDTLSRGRSSRPIAEESPQADLNNTNGNEDAGKNPGSHPAEGVNIMMSTNPPLTCTSTSTALLWLLTTALSLITAPLVEPRYFILPWVFYRLLVPPWSSSSSSSSSSAATAVWGGGSGTSASGSGKTGGSGRASWWEEVDRTVDRRLMLETVWFLVVNAVTMYVFLFKPFYWRGEDGELLDGGRVQRFMW
ncbi:glycosyltransferase family 59 protein [Chaetomium strumarium]|uniref:Dol-P-Glc:Glc(2)Man(9)GlcNAc(2)-PP-Dol alpha-1,2-glucosyltransferase n=1 Tax=Chaetomium strumarium TaxID=1170767 RepID=A0AAJ0M2Y9_9PEZI|nr:glycosyltransferase family 59 protein [Chaetomium strumarium]